MPINEAQPKFTPRQRLAAMARWKLALWALTAILIVIAVDVVAGTPSPEGIRGL